MNELERIMSGIKDLESRYYQLGETRKRYKHMPKEEYPTYRQLVCSYMKGLKKYPEIHNEISADMHHMIELLDDTPRGGEEHRRKMKEYIKTLKKVTSALEKYDKKTNV